MGENGVDCVYIVPQQVRYAGMSLLASLCTLPSLVGLVLGDWTTEGDAFGLWGVCLQTALGQECSLVRQQVDTNLVSESCFVHFRLPYPFLPMRSLRTRLCVDIFALVSTGFLCPGQSQCSVQCREEVEPVPHIQEE